MTILDGIPASPGVAIGKVMLLDQDRIELQERTLSSEEVEAEVSSFLQAIRDTVHDLHEIKNKVSIDLGSKQGAIFETHLMIIQDKYLVDRAVEVIRKQRRKADVVVYEILRATHDSLLNTQDEYLKERAADIRDIRRRIIQKLQGIHGLTHIEIPEPSVIASFELTPSMTVTLERKNVLGFATELGGRTSHAAILAKAIEVPSVVGIHQLINVLKPGDTLIVDGTQGKVIVNPDPSLLDFYKQKREGIFRFTKSLETELNLPPVTQDGHRIELSANLELPEEIESVQSHGAQGIGLFRTEYLFIFRDHLPDEEEQFQDYYRVAKSIAPLPVIIRTLDLGGDKIFKLTDAYKENNPFLGLRSIRLSLKNPDLFRTQLRAILRSSALGNVKIMFPLISSLTELRKAKIHLEATKQELKKNKISIDESIELGIMIETPSAALTAHDLAQEVKFFSIGTNDLVQYVLAVDRSNTTISNLYQSFHPAVLKLIQATIEAGHAHGIWVGLCGEMAADPLATLLLLGMGLDEFSANPAVLPEIKNIIRSTTYERAQTISAHCFTLNTAD
ncbi:MAG: phosphoenolpyruvate--protein phosphotransferase, partial [Patescibacteria group bacterium]|nr:phosphoenolpyruvate--protein phosphotransferase [Patescibacteria group bacterium]